MHLTIFRICAPLLMALAFLSSGAAQAAPPTPSLLSPANLSNVGGTSIAFLWSSSSGATNYYLQVATDPGFVNNVYNSWVGNYIGITLTGLPDNGQVYYWRVAAGNATGSSYFSFARSVTNGPSAVPATPVQISPANGAKVSGTSIVCSWARRPQGGERG